MKPTEARALLFLHYVSWLLIVAQTSKFYMAQMVELGFIMHLYFGFTPKDEKTNLGRPAI